MKKMVVLGAYSSIAKAVLRKHASKSTEFLLIGKDENRLKSLSDDLLTRGSRAVTLYQADLSDTSSHAALFESIRKTFPDTDSFFFSYGVLPDQHHLEKNPSDVLASIDINYVSHVSLLLHVAKFFEEADLAPSNEKTPKVIAVVTSVAGDLGRKSNYIYGSSKGGLSLFLDGLRARLASHRISVVDIRPGFVDTPMTEHLKKNPLFASPESIAPRILKAMKKGAPVTYVPFYWKHIMCILKTLPRKILYKLPI